MQLVLPTETHLPAYVAALERGWSADTLRPNAAREERARIASDSHGFLASMDDPDAAAGPVTLPDGSQVARLPSIRRWMWVDGEFCGSIGLRWPVGLGPLPPHVLGHIGYAVVPWQRGRGCATRALGLMLIEAQARGLPWVDITTDPDNLASQKVILANAAVLVEHFTKPAAYGASPGLRYRVSFS